MSSDEIKMLQNRLDEINSALNGLLMFVLEDFLDLTRIIKTVSLVFSTENEYVSGLVRELQYYDIIHQKTSHMKVIHEWIQHDVAKARQLPGRSPGLLTNMIRLNQLQYQIASADFTQSINAIQTIMNESEVASALRISQSNRVFMHVNLINSATRLIDSAFNELVTHTKGWNAITVYEKLPALTRLYSMETERNVLQAYLQDPSVDKHRISMACLAKNDGDIDLF